MADQNNDSVNKGVGANLQGSTAKHTYNVPPAKVPAGEVSPNSDKRGKQG